MTGAKAKSAQAGASGGNLGVEVDGTIWSGGTVPISGGPGIELKRENRGSTTWEESSDFVFAFRVVKVMVRKKTGEVSVANYTRGGMFGREGETIESAIPFEVDFSEHLQAAEVGLDVEEVLEDDEVVLCAAPREVW